MSIDSLASVERRVRERAPRGAAAVRRQRRGAAVKRAASAPRPGSRWWAVSALTALARESTPRLLVLEDVYLVLARSAAEAGRRGAALARRSARGSKDATWKGEPVRVRFAGVRKVVAIAGDGAHACGAAELTDGMAATYSRFLVHSRRELAALAQGRPVEVLYEE